MIRYNIIPKKNPITKEVKYYAMKDGVGAARFMTEEMYATMSEASNVPVAYIPQALEAIAQAVQMFVLNGHCVRVGHFGSFQPQIVSRGASTAADFGVGNIKRVRIRFRPSPEMRYILQKTTFEKAPVEEDLEELGE